MKRLCKPKEGVFFVHLMGVSLVKVDPSKEYEIINVNIPAQMISIWDPHKEDTYIINLKHFNENWEVL